MSWGGLSGPCNPRLELEGGGPRLGLNEWWEAARRVAGAWPVCPGAAASEPRQVTVDCDSLVPVS